MIFTKENVLDEMATELGTTRGSPFAAVRAELKADPVGPEDRPYGAPLFRVSLWLPEDPEWVQNYLVTRDMEAADVLARKRTEDNLESLPYRDFWKMWTQENLEMPADALGVRLLWSVNPRKDELIRLTQLLVDRHGVEPALVTRKGDHVRETPHGFVYWRAR